MPLSALVSSRLSCPDNAEEHGSVCALHVLQIKLISLGRRFYINTLKCFICFLHIHSQTFPEWASPDREGSSLGDTVFTDGPQTLWCHYEIWWHSIPWQHKFTDMSYGQLKENNVFHIIIPLFKKALTHNVFWPVALQYSEDG